MDNRDVKMVDGYLYRVNEDGTLELAGEHDCHRGPEDSCMCDRDYTGPDNPLDHYAPEELGMYPIK